jgi:hypothetical protein
VKVARALGISVHTGWGACVVVAGTPAKPEIVENRLIDILDDSERFCFHMAAEMDRNQVARWLADLKKKALTNAKRALSALAKQAGVCAIVAKPGDPGELDAVLASHPRLHTAEGCFYRDVLREACTIPVELVAPKSLDVSTIGKLAPPPWGTDQKHAALAAWKVLKR